MRMHHAYNIWEGFVYLSRCILHAENRIRVCDKRTSEWINRSRKLDGIAAPVTEELNVR